MMMIMKESFHYFLLPLLFLFYVILILVYLKPEAVEYGVPCSCGEGTRANDVSETRKRFSHGTHTDVSLFIPCG